MVKFEHNLLQGGAVPCRTPSLKASRRGEGGRMYLRGAVVEGRRAGRGTVMALPGCADVESLWITWGASAPSPSLGHV